MAGQFTIDDYDVQPLSRQPFGHQRAGDAAANDQGVATDVFDQGMTGRAGRPGKPGRAAAMKVVLLGGVGTEIGNEGTGGWGKSAADNVGEPVPFRWTDAAGGCLLSRRSGKQGHDAKGQSKILIFQFVVSPLGSAGIAGLKMRPNPNQRLAS